jgi:tetratricopeptide (TPR) repeat protein
MATLENLENSSIGLSESLPIKSATPISHNLEDTTFDIEIEKKFLDSYALRHEDPKKLIKVKDYSVADVETSRNLFGKIQNEVITQSESTNEAKTVNWESDLKYIKEAKEQANKFINKPDMAMVEYLKILKEIDEIFAPIKEYHLFEIDANLRAIVDQKKLIMSNLALAYSKKGFHRDAIELDLKIIGMDEKFDKSYARLVASYLQIDNLHEAQVYANKLRSSFNSETVAKYENILGKFDEAIKKSENVNKCFKEIFSVIKNIKNLFL